VLLAASVAVALNVVEVLSATDTDRPEAKLAALPLVTGAPEQSLLVYSLTVEPASAVPVMLGLLLFAGDAGVEPNPLGAVGSVESSTYVYPIEQAEVLFAASVAVALNVVELSPATDTDRPAAKLAAEPLATGAPEQSLVVYSFTVEPASAVPVINGLLLFAGDAGAEPNPLGGVGTVESST
jgi:multisubunit Na+/H+ antiporter MnhC subunit